MDFLLRFVKKNIIDKILRLKCVTSDYFLDDYNIRFEGQGFES